jgi:alpha-L-rhamnosidase
MNNNLKRWNKDAKWLGQPGVICFNWLSKVLPSPFFRKTFTIDQVADDTVLRICGLGYYELYINGQKVGDHVLDPVVTHYDKKVFYVTYNISKYLVKGVNVIGVILGNGWYNCHTPGTFDKASWRDYPKFLLEMDINGECVLASDQSWKFSSGPVLFDGLRNGETYDARLELNRWLEPDYNDIDWERAARVPPPGGVLEEQTMPPCKVMRTLSPVMQWDIMGGTVYDIGQNMAGWVRIRVCGETGAKVTLRYGERLNESRCVDQTTIAQYVLGEPDKFQTDRYILKGDGVEVWEPRFTYHGFQYVQAKIEGNAKIEKLEGRVVHTAFEKIGKFKCSDKLINKLQNCTEWSYVSNFVGIPTDCPHREKNGWTGDAQLAAETGLFNYSSASSYAQWIDSIASVQRPSGQLPGIVPGVGWRYNWGGGPAWDSALLLIPWYIYLYTGNDSVIQKHYNAMKKYVDYCTYMADNHIVKFGLGDWCHVDHERIVDTALTDTSYYFCNAMLMAKFAGMTRRSEDQKYYSELAAKIKESFNARFYKGNGSYAKGEQTAMGCALYQGLAEESEKNAVIEALIKSVKENGNKPDFGVLGAKYVPRVLADNGQIELAYKLITQPEFPGWVNWLNQGATTLWENWDGRNSLNHIMFGDISAWFYQYLVGIMPDPENPGFRKLLVKPQPVKALDWVNAEYHIPAGKLEISWKKNRDKFDLNITTPVETMLVMPDGPTYDLPKGQHNINIA